MKIKNALLLLLTASIWGVAFVAQSVGMDYVGPFTFNCVRCLMGGVVLLPCIWFFDRKNKRRKQVPAIPGARKTLVMGGSAAAWPFAWPATSSSLESSTPQWERLGS